MAENSAIEWTTSTFNPWRGCTKVSAGCANCYAETLSGRNPGTLGVWGPNGTRVIASEAMWREPVKWNREAEHDQYIWDNLDGIARRGQTPPERPRVFCASLADVFEDWQGPMRDSKGQPLFLDPSGKWVAPPMKPGEQWRHLDMQDVRARLFSLIDATPNLDWLLLTKRPENLFEMLPWQVNPWGNVWLGTSVENQAAADERIPHLLRVPAAVRFLSCEPLLGPVELSGLVKGHCPTHDFPGGFCHGPCPDDQRISWVIVGGESGPGARPCRVEWVRSIVEQCRAASVPVFVKQLGGNIVTRNDMIEDAFNGKDGWPDTHVEHNIHGFREDHQGADCRVRLVDKKGGDMAEWPESLRVREFPTVKAGAA